MKKKEYLVGYSDNTTGQSFKVLNLIGTSFKEDGVRVKLINYPFEEEYKICDPDDVVHDLYLNDEFAKTDYSELTKTLNIGRLPKHKQHALLKLAASKLKPKNYRHLNTKFAVERMFPTGAIKHPYLIKDVGGARGMGIISSVDSTSNLALFLGKLEHLRRSNVVYPNSDERTMSKDDISGASAPSVKVNAVEELDKILKVANFTIGPAEEFEPYESIKKLLSTELFIQEKIEYDDLVEYRLIQCGGQIKVFPRSELREESRSKTTKAISHNTNPLIKEAVNFLKKAELQLFGSYDLWVSEKNNEWGIFEFQNQYGWRFVDLEDLQDLLRKGIIDLIKKYE